MRVGFAETDITPPLGARKIGWLREIIITGVLDPIFAKVAVIESDADRVAFVQLDTLSVRWSTVNDLRRRIEVQYGFPGAGVLVAATHNHCGPAVAKTGVVPRDEAYIETMTAKVVEAFGHALDARVEAEVGFRHVFEFGISMNRRIVMRDGTVKTQNRFSDPNALCVEGPMDPEVAVLAARDRAGRLIGCVVNFTCHPTHHGGTGDVTAGYPGVFANEMRARGCPATLFLNGASGNIISWSDRIQGPGISMEEMGRRLADDAQQALQGMEYRDRLPVAAVAKTVQLPYRRFSPNEVAGTIRGAQRFIDPKIYDRDMPDLVKRIRERGSQPAEVQALFVGDTAWVGIPAEYFIEHALRIKLESWPTHALVVGHANGMVGYVPTKQAFERGGYETTFAFSSRMAPEAGDILADAAIEVIRAHRPARAAQA